MQEIEGGFFFFFFLLKPVLEVYYVNERTVAQ